MILDPLAALFYLALLIAVTALTMRKPAYGIAALIVVEPFTFFQGPLAETAWLSRVTLFGVVLGLLAYPDAFAPIADRAPVRIVTAGLLVFAATAMSFVNATYDDLTTRETLKILGYLLLFCAVVASFRLDPDRAVVRAALLVTIAAVALLALAQEIVGSPSAMLLNGEPVPRIAGPLEGPNQLAGYFDVALPLSLAFLIDEPTAFGNVVAFLVVMADLLTFSRGGMIGAIAGIAVIAYVERGRLRTALAPVFSGLLAGLGAALALGAHVHAMGWAHFWDLSQSDYAGGVGTRPQLWHAAWVLWLRHPLLGVGAGNFEREIPLTGLLGVRTHANSLYLQSLVEGGIPMIAATLWLVYTSIATFARERVSSPFVLAAFAAGIALALHQIIDFLTFYPKVGNEWWIVMALAAAEIAVTVRFARPACA